MRIEENQILELLNRLPKGEQEELSRMLNKAFQSEISLTTEALATNSLEQLITLRDIIQGYILTKNYVPNIIDAYNIIDTEKLPSKISFGSIKETPENGD